MRIIRITNQEQWDGFVAAQTHAQFAQSFAWGEFQSSNGHEIWRLAAVEGEQIAAVAKIIKKPLLFGRSYFYCDRGPVFIGNQWEETAGRALLEEIGRLAQAEKSVFLRFDPVFDLRAMNQALIKTIDIQPQKTAILDLTKDEDELLAAMHQKTRYNIRLAQKKGVSIERVGAERFEEFWQLMEETRERDEFKLHSKRYYQAMIDLGFIKLYFALLGGKVIAASIVAQYGDMATYVHGGSSNENREVMAPFLLQWTAILDARKEGVRYYDFYGVDEKKWPGVTRFKMGFNPGVFEYPGTHDLVYDKPWYTVYKWLRKLRRSF
jgi:lipid II:glycine glycyltransferase (peptidoglycan interpeptide bridge formation enzyme)